MKRSRKMKASSSSSSSSHSSKYLPDELLSMFLEKLPVKMLLRFRCVCKLWRSIIDNPKFVYAHLQLCNNNNSNYNSGKLLLLEGKKSGGEYGCELTLRKAFNLRKIGNLFHSLERYYFYGKSNSLVLMGSDYEMMENGLRICNPSIRKSLVLPSCPLDHHLSTIFFIFGLVSRTSDFKVIAFQLQRAGQMRVAVYTLSERIWAVRDNDFNFDFSTSFGEFRGFYFRSNPSYLEGAIHWLGKPPSDHAPTSLFLPTHLISFDLETEQFSFLELPVLLDLLDEGSENWRFVFVRCQSLAVFSNSPTTCNIWVLSHADGASAWTLWFSGPSTQLACNLFYQLDQRSSVIYFDGDDEGEAGYLFHEKSSYNIASGQVRSMGKSLSPYVDFMLHSESLVLAGEDDPESPFIWK